jgi:predicted alpha/beta superfamily hydrolase
VSLRQTLKLTKIMKNLIYIFIGILSFYTATARRLEKTNSHHIKSSFNDKTYELNVSLPKKYTNQDSLHYPVLYVLDGKYSFNSMSSIREGLDLGKEIKEIIIVSIESVHSTENEWFANRHNDYTPSCLPQADTLWSKILNISEGKLKSGGAAYFLTTLEKDLIPFIDSHYKTTADRGLSGHSLGGLFTGYCLLKKPGLFKRYGINSPSFWWNNSEMVQVEANFANQNTVLKAKVFFSVGSSEDALMRAAFTTFTNAIKSRNYTGLDMTVKLFDGETHVSVVPACSSRTLKVLYGSFVQ